MCLGDSQQLTASRAFLAGAPRLWPTSLVFPNRPSTPKYHRFSLSPCRPARHGCDQHASSSSSFSAAAPTPQDRYRDAEHCLKACDAVVATHLAAPPPPAAPRAIAAAQEVQAEATADMARRWGVVYLNILQARAHPPTICLSGLNPWPLRAEPRWKAHTRRSHTSLAACTSSVFCSRTRSFQPSRSLFFFAASLPLT